LTFSKLHAGFTSPVLASCCVSAWNIGLQEGVNIPSRLTFRRPGGGGDRERDAAAPTAVLPKRIHWSTI